MKSLLLILLLFSVKVKSQSLVVGFPSDRLMASDTAVITVAHGTCTSCCNSYEYEALFSTLFVPSGTNLYFRFDSIATNDSVKIWRNPDISSGRWIHMGDTVRYFAASSSILLYAANPGVFITSMHIIGTPDSIQPYYCLDGINYTISADGCSTPETIFYGGYHSDTCYVLAASSLSIKEFNTTTKDNIVMDIQGRVIQTGDINVSTLPNGIYYLFPSRKRVVKM